MRQNIISPVDVIDHPTIQRLARLAAEASLKRDAPGYETSLHMYHTFCDVFNIPESNRLPASFELLHSFILWAAAVPEILPTEFASQHPPEPVAVATVRKYFEDIKMYHYAQGWPAPVSEGQLAQINWSLRGLENLQRARRSKTPRLPVTLDMLRHLQTSLNLDTSFDACVWAAASCAFWGLMRFGEVSIAPRTSFSGSKNFKRSDAILDTDSKGRPVMKLMLPSAKPGTSQTVVVVGEPDVCPIAAVRNLFRKVPASPADPMFSWQGQNGAILSLTKEAALKRIEEVLAVGGWNSIDGYSFRRGGLSYFLAKGVNPEILRLAGRWDSLAFEKYLQAFEQKPSQHLDN